MVYSLNQNRKRCGGGGVIWYTEFGMKYKTEWNADFNSQEIDWRDESIWSKQSKCKNKKQDLIYNTAR